MEIELGSSDYVRCHQMILYDDMKFVDRLVTAMTNGIHHAFYFNVTDPMNRAKDMAIEKLQAYKVCPRCADEYEQGHSCFIPGSDF